MQPNGVDFLRFFVILPCISNEMNFSVIEYNLVLIGWVVAILLGTILLVIKSPNATRHISYCRGKNTCALAILLFGIELLFQWLIRFPLRIIDPALSVSIYLFTFCLASLLLTAGFCTMLAPTLLNKRQRAIAFFTITVYAIYLITNYFIPNHSLQLVGILLGCLLLFVITCICIYKCMAIYRRAIKELRTYYSDVVENLMRWMPGVGVGIMLFLITAPITCLCPRWVGVYQMALGIIMFIYAFICTIKFSFSYNAIAAAIHPDEPSSPTVDHQSDLAEAGSKDGGTTLSASLQEVIQDKEERWRQQGGYRTAGVTIEQTAHAMGTNRSYLSRYLNEVRHMTFYEWVAHMRINEAQSIMLQERDTTIEQVATRVGFSSPSTFSSTFKKLVGESPVKWRNHH